MTTVLKRIRDLMKTVSNNNNTAVQAVIITNSDQHMNEYLAENDKLLAFTSGFSGSAGTAVITETEAHLWTDGRYWIQAEKELNPSDWHLMREGAPGTPMLREWLQRKFGENSNMIRVGADGKLWPYNKWLELEKFLRNCDVTLVELPDSFWQSVRESFPLTMNRASAAVKVHDLVYAGESVGVKIAKVWQEMARNKVDTLVLTALDEIAWLLNLRGQDVEYNPVFFAYLLVYTNELHLFVDAKKIGKSVIEHLAKDKINIRTHTYESFYQYLIRCAGTAEKVWFCQTANYQVYKCFDQCRKHMKTSPVKLMKIVKNPVETNGMINAHIKDAVALCRYFAWLELAILRQEKPLTEISAADKLEEFRRDENDYVGPSFPTISASGPNGAVVHYRADSFNDRELTTNELYLCDSGAQYLDGTTDVTRTIHFGNPTQYQKECFTRVLQGMISLATVVFPKGIKGCRLDSFARRSLWEAGLDYKHGTGHGVGSYLFVHEGPIRIGSEISHEDPGLQANMFLSDEPGYYENGDFGIRIENIIRTVPAQTTNTIDPSTNEFLKFDTVTLCPIQQKMLIPTILTKNEIDFLNDYHQQVFRTVGPILQERSFTEAFQWLERETAPIKI